jgi:EAL domain-containing protein (putative c-di-GMP-specific phosphodiesterase class I)
MGADAFGSPGEVADESRSVLVAATLAAQAEPYLVRLEQHGLTLVTRFCTRLHELVRELKNDRPDLVLVLAGPAFARPSDVQALCRRAGSDSPIIFVGAVPADAAAALCAGGVEVVGPGDHGSLAQAVCRALRLPSLVPHAGTPPPGDASGTPPLPTPAAVTLPDQQALVDRLAAALAQSAPHAALAVLEIAPGVTEPARAAVSRALLEARVGGTQIELAARLPGARLAVVVTLQGAVAGVLTALQLQQELTARMIAAGIRAGAQLLSVGIAPPRLDTTDTPDDWLARALQACDIAVGSPHGYAVLGATSLASLHAAEIPALMQSALAEDGLRLVYQPIVSLRGDAGENYEVLVRLPHPAGDDLLPADFLGPAEAVGLMPEVDRWVIRRSVAELARLRARSQRARFFVRISGQSLVDEEVLITICDTLRDQQAKGAWLVFQLRRTDLRFHRDAAERLVEGLRRINCQIALDRYGDDPDEEELLRCFRFDFVKLSPRLTRNAGGDADLLRHLKTVVATLRAAGTESVVTGVEDAESLVFLWSAGIDHVQGFFLHEPTPTITYQA